MEKIQQSGLRNEEERFLTGKGAQSLVYEYTDPVTHKQLVRKEMRGISNLDGGTIEQVASDKKKVYECLKKYIGEYLPETHYIISKNAAGFPKIQIIQEKINGKTLKEKSNDNEWEPEDDEFRAMIMQSLADVFKDKSLESNLQAYRINEAFANPENTMYDPITKKYWVVDW